MTTAQAWIVRAGRDDEYAQVALDRHLIGIGWRRAGDLAGATAQRSVRALVTQAYPQEPAAIRTLYSLQLHAFRSTMRPGDLVVLLKRNRPDVAVGEVTGDYRFAPGAGPAHVRPVNWLQPRLRRSELGSDLLAVPALAAVSRVTRPADVSRIADAAKGLPAAAEPAARPAGEPSTVSPVDNLRRNLRYARDLAAAGSHLEALGVTAFEFRDVYRAAWVQAVASLDHWVRQEIATRTLRLLDEPDLPRPPTFGRILGRKVLAEKQAAGPHALRAAILERLSGHSVYQNLEKIYLALEDVADVTDLWTRAAALMDPPMESADLQQRLTSTVARRHVIVHRGDEDPVNPPYKSDIDVIRTMAAIDLVDQTTAAILLVVDGK